MKADWLDGLESILRNATGYADPMSLMLALDKTARERPHLRLISDKLKQAVLDVEAGHNRRIIISLPPRHGKTTECAVFLPLWVLTRHPHWQCGITSYGATLAERSGREVRRIIEATPSLGLVIAGDVKAASQWEVDPPEGSETLQRGGVIARGVGSGLTGFGVRVLIVDDPFKDFVEAHSPVTRKSVWEWWLSVALTRLEGPSLVVVLQTRWHEDDLVGRLLSHEYEGDPAEWIVLRIPAIADALDDPLGRQIGEPLLAPYADETPEQSLERWEQARISVGAYVWAALYQQKPAPSKGTIIDTSWFHYWTANPARVSHDAEGNEDGHVVHLNVKDLASDLGAVWLDSWDCSFKATDGTDYVVGQVWAKDRRARRFLIDQSRARRTFTGTIAAMRDTHTRYPHIHKHVIEEKANGSAVIDVLQKEISGIKATNPDASKEVRLRAVTPEMESGHVFLPHPSDPGNEWVLDWLEELRKFPYDSHDDQADAASQALLELRGGGASTIASPAKQRTTPDSNKRQSPLAARRIQRR